jgi:hypothetical protein
VVLISPACAKPWTLAAIEFLKKMTFAMNAVFLRRLGRGTIIFTLLFGILLICSYSVTKDVEAGTLLYFYVLFAGFVNAFVFLLLLIFSLLTNISKRKLLITAGFIALTYFILLAVTYVVL